MAGTLLSQPPTTFDFYPTLVPQQQRKQDVPTLSPVSLYSPQGDFGTDSAASPGSPSSPVFTNPYQLPTSDDWINWEDDNKAADLFKSEPFEPDLNSVPPRNLPHSPAVNPMELSNPAQADDVPFGQEGVNDNQPLFSNPQPEVSSTTQQQPTSIIPPHGIKRSPSASPQMSHQPTSSASARYPSRKRKSSSSGDSHSARSSASPPPGPRHVGGVNAPKKTAHNMIEKRYRTNLNDKIAALRDSVPALRVMVHRLEAAQQGVGVGNGGAVSSEEADGEDMLMKEDLGGLAPAHKLNKATILGKATEYIAHLERKNRNLAKENAALRGRVEGFEMLVMSRGGAGGVWT
ncbi:putative helix-loop-helix dna-binding domain-containing protein [Zalerion maritima]|uniref:Helix-loop-helix dna-binding domain-containing protein n=1 Tax=Zalerion maritima TaxID=339359 RepID=A0AAD5S1X1_9PEZI|nr:putative helix-loop-helix dna-binding domain-containing protein [Zalerion maritima]